ncbi:uncharacterized protein LOC130990689 [Salvia miltiorrhiza]|uniref:uncharacterized protein LOC130990689 n=1 Tax=Salvia miltiorrhiza TaxID=226208 RepID=UPI0025ACDD56|nr:uncharacterized protein LOC130990689 [Salvia miltiorrhiza]
MAENPEPPNDNTNKTLRDMMFPNNLNLRPSAIVLPEITGNWELKHTLIQILPKYSDMPGEDPQMHLQDFEMACGTVRTASQALGEYIRLLTFPFSLLEGAREWLYDLPEGSIQTWQELQSKFLEKYFPAARIQNLRTRISNIKMGSGEVLYEYWGRFKQMLAKCPQHQIPDHDLIRYFVGGLRRQDRQWLHAACGGSILNKSAAEAFKLIADMAEESRDEEGTIVRTTPVPAPSAQDDKLDKLCNMFEKFMTNQGTPNQGNPNIRKPVKACQLCMANSHATDECPQLFEEVELNAVGQQPGGNNGGQHQKPFEPYRQQFNNQGWRQHENLRSAGNKDLLFNAEIERLVRLNNANRRRAEQEAQARERQLEAEREMAENPEPPNDNTNKTLRDMMFPNNLNLRPSAIVLPEITGNWELKHTLIQILPKYSDMPGEDPQRHL